MNMTDFNDLALLVEVARAGTLPIAARQTGIPKSTISRRILDLEARLGVPLLHRGARQLQLTAVGERLVAECGPLLARMAVVESTVVRDSALARGSLRIASPSDFGIWVLAPIIEAFALDHPHLTIEVAYEHRVVELVAERFDVAVRVGPVTDPGLMMRTIGAIEGAVVASPEYIAQRGLPTCPDDLRVHEALVFVQPPFGPTWTLSHADGRTVEVDVQPRLSTNNLTTLLSAARRGLGLARLPDYIYSNDCTRGTLVRLLPGWSTGTRKVSLVWPEARHTVPAHRAFVEFVAARLRRPGASQ